MTILTDGRRNRRWAHCLRIAGLPYAYWGGAPPPAAALPAEAWGEGGPEWVPVNAIRRIAPIREELPQLGGVAVQSPVTFELAGGGDGPEVEGDPIDTFAKLGVAAAPWWGLMVGVDAGAGVSSALRPEVEPPFDLLIDREPPTVEGTLVFHVGQEAFLVTGADGSEVGGEDPYRLSVSARAVGFTVPRRHDALLQTRDQAIVTMGPVPVFWRSRWATWVAYEMLPGGGVGAPVELMTGFLESSPQPEADGLTLKVALVPLTALLTQEATIPAGRTRLARGVHFFEPGRASEVWVGEQIEQGGKWKTTLDAAAVAGSGSVEVGADAVASWELRFDPALPPEHPRSGTLGYTRIGVQYVMPVSGTDGDDIEFDDANDPPINLPDNGLVYVHPTYPAWRRGRIVSNAPNLLRWPGVGGDADSSALGRLTAAHSGAPRWTSVRFEPTRVTVSSNGDSGLLPDVLIKTTKAADDFGLPLFNLLEGDGRSVYLEHDAPTAASLLWYPIDLRGEGLQLVTPPESRPGFFRFLPEFGDDRKSFSVAGYALAFYQEGERWFLVEDDIDVSSGRVVVELNGPGGLGVSVEVATVTEEVLVGELGSERDGDELRLIRVLGRIQSFGEWGDDDVVIIRSARRTFTSSGELLEFLLTSPDHLGIPTSALDLGTIRGEGAEPEWVLSWGIPETTERLTYASVIGGILRVTRSTLAMRTGPDGTCRMTRVPVGVEVAGEVVADISVGAWAVGQPPTWGTDDRLLNAVTVRAAYGEVFDAEGESELKWRLERGFDSRTSQRAFDQRTSAELDLWGALTVDAGSSEIEVQSRAAIRLYEQPRRVWRGVVGAYLGAVAQLGATVQAASPRLRDYAGARLTAPATAIVTAREVDVWGETGCRLTLTHTARISLGWAPALEVASVVNETSVTVQPTTYSGTDDLAWLQAGDLCRCVPLGGAPSTRTATAVDVEALKVTFSLAHGLAVGDVIIPPTYGAGAGGQRMKIYAFLADEAGTLGGAGAPGAIYV